MSYGFQEDRTTYIREQILEDKGDGDAGLDISSGFKAHFRMWQTTGGGTVIDQELTIVAITEGDYADTGDKKSGVEGYITPNEAYGYVKCRIVLEDTGTVDADTISGNREVVFKPAPGEDWNERVVASPAS